MANFSIEMEPNVRIEICELEMVEKHVNYEDSVVGIVKIGCKFLILGNSTQMVTQMVA